MHIDLNFKYTLKAVAHSSTVHVIISSPPSCKALERYGFQKEPKTS